MKRQNKFEALGQQFVKRKKKTVRLHRCHGIKEISRLRQEDLNGTPNWLHSESV
jgi:hypothetical protein